MDDKDLRGRVVSMEHKGAAHDQRLAALEIWRQHNEVADAVKNEQFKHMDARFSTLDNKIDAVNNTLSWFGKLMIGAIIMAFIAFIVNGGLKIPV